MLWVPNNQFRKIHFEIDSFLDWEEFNNLFLLSHPLIPYLIYLLAIWRLSFWIWGSLCSPHRWAVNQKIESRPPRRLFALASCAGVLFLPNLDWLPSSDRKIHQQPFWHQHKGHVGETVNENMETGRMFLTFSFPDRRQWEPKSQWSSAQGL